MKYSVLMSLYYKENPKFLKKSLDSMINQTIKPDQIVIVKDGKLTEELNIVVDEYYLEYPEIFTIIQLEKNLGLGLALNEGIKVCRNNLIARMDTDDISLKSRCEKQLKEFEKDEELVIVGSNTDEFYDNPNNIITSRIVPIEHKEILKFSKRRSPFNHPTVMYKKEYVIECGGYRDILRKEDIDLFVRMLNKGYKAKNINESLVLFRSNEDNFKRRKSWVNCKSYISVIYKFWKMGYSSTLDLIFVIISQIFMFISPLFILKFISNRLLRKNNVRKKINEKNITYINN